MGKKRDRMNWEEEDIEVLDESSKATPDESPPNVRGKPLPRDEALAGSEITESDIEKAQAWVDRAMREEGFVD